MLKKKLTQILEKIKSSKETNNNNWVLLMWDPQILLSNSIPNLYIYELCHPGVAPGDITFVNDL
jgi:hypothetical protein